MIKFVDLVKQYESIQGDIDRAISGVIRNAAFIGGSAVELFERRFAAYQDANYCVAVGNGTDAIEIALEAMNIEQGREVIVPANSFIATSEAVTRSQLRVVFADVCRDSYTLDPDDVHRRISGNTSAVIAVHLYGQPCDMDRLTALTQRFGLKLIEDCAQSHGAVYKGRRVGTFGDVGTFSFYPGKVLGAFGDGGAITTSSEILATRCRMIANHGRVEKYDHQFEGRNSRLDGLQAAVLLAKLPHLEEWIVRRNEIAAIYLSELVGIGDIALPCTLHDCRHVYHLFVIRTLQRDALAKYLMANGIQTGIHYPIALPKLKAYKYIGQAEEPLFANQVDQTLLSLPIGEHMSRENAHTVAETIKAFYASDSSQTSAI